MTTPTKNNTPTSETHPIKAPTRFIPAGGPTGFLSGFWKAAAGRTSAARCERSYNGDASQGLATGKADDNNTSSFTP